MRRLTEVNSIACWTSVLLRGEILMMVWRSLSIYACFWTGYYVKGAEATMIRESIRDLVKTSTSLTELALYGSQKQDTLCIECCLFFSIRF